MFKHQKRCHLFVALIFFIQLIFVQMLNCAKTKPDWTAPFIRAIQERSSYILVTGKISNIALAANTAKNNGLQPEDILVAFDIDNTIATTTDPLASDQCFTEIFKATDHDLEKTLVFYFTRQTHTKLSPVESEYLPDRAYIPGCFADTIQQLGTVGTINFLQAFGAKTMGLTARSEQIIDVTISQLTEQGIDFTYHSPSINEYNFGEPPTTAQIGTKLIRINKDCRYKNGILFCGNNSKGTKLLEFLNASNYHPKLIIFIDDKLKNIINVKDAIYEFNYLNPSPIVFMGARYSRCDPDVESFHANLNRFIQTINSILQCDLRRSPIPWEAAR